jgi:Lon protease-like protein
MIDIVGCGLKRHNGIMAAALIPLFPLEVVVFPRTALPLHIFEERYKKMVTEAIAGTSEFGVVLAKANGIVNAGCTVMVEKLVHTYPDGRMDILTRGQRRFEVGTIDQELDVLRAEVRYFDDDDFSPVPAELRQQAIEYFEEMCKLEAPRGRGEADLSDPQISFQLAQDLPDLDFLHNLLRQRSETGRLRELNQYLSRYVPRQQRIEKVKTIAPTNGFAGKYPGP